MSWSIMEIIGSGPAAELCSLDNPERWESELETRSSPGGITAIGHVSGLPANSAGISTGSPTLAVFEILGVLVRRCMKLGIMSTDVRFFSRVVRFLDADVGRSSAVKDIVKDSSTWTSSDSSDSRSSRSSGLCSTSLVERRLVGENDGCVGMLRLSSGTENVDGSGGGWNEKLGGAERSRSTHGGAKSSVLRRFWLEEDKPKEVASRSIE